MFRASRDKPRGASEHAAPPQASATHRVDEMFARWAARTPDALAVSAPDAVLSYGEVEQRADRLADRLRALGVDSGAPVALCLARSAGMVVGALGILKAGGAYVALDPSYPADRLGFMIGDCGADVIVTSEPAAAALDALPANVVVLDRLDPEPDPGPGSGPVNSPVGEIRDDRLAYVIYTSGSTGSPKGVLVGHRGLGNLIEWHRRTFAVTEADRATQIASPAFDAAVWELWPYLTAGASIHIPPEEVRADPVAIRDWLLAERITVTFLPTALAEVIVTLDWPHEAPLRYLLTGGDKLYRHPPPGLPFALVNNYGPTEGTVVTTSGVVPPAESPAGTPSIGSPISNVKVYIVDEQLDPVSEGETGELLIGGPSVALGYLGQPALTAEKFIPDAFTADPGATLFRTGDYVRRRSDGELDFIGRVDEQVQIRGHRVELGEISVALRRHPAVRSSVVVLDKQGSSEPRLVAYLVSDQSPQDSEELRADLGLRLPAYMVPNVFVQLEEMPFTASGKLDRARLPAPSVAEPPESAGPQGELEEVLESIVAELLGLSRVGVNESFFMLGGHSLLGAQLIARIGSRFGVEMSLRSLFDNPTVAEMATEVERLLVADLGSAPPTRSRRSGPAPLSPAQEQLWYFSRLAPENPVYNEAVSIRKEGPFDATAFRAAFNEIVRRHEIWRTTFDDVDGEPLQIVGPAPTLELPIIDLSAMTAEEREREAVRLAAEAARVPYDLRHGPLLRPILIRFSEDHHRLYLCMHHLISDGVSLYRIILPELATLYDDFAGSRAPSLPAPAIQYSDYAHELRELGEGQDHARRVDYWRRRLSGASTLQLPLDHQRPLRPRFRGATMPLRISVELSARLRSLSHASGVTLFQALAAAFAVLLYRYSGQEEVVFGTLADMRERRELEGMVGYCLTPLVARIDMGAEPSFNELLERVRDDLIDGLSNLIPFERLVRELHPHREPGANPLFQAALVLEPSMVAADPAWSLHQMEAEVSNAVGSAKFDLLLELDERPEGQIDGRLIYDRDLFDPETAAQIAGHWITVLEGVVPAPDRPVSELPLLTAEQHHRQLVEWNATAAEYPQDACLHELVSAQAERSPDAVAAVFADQQLTYRELEERADTVARRLAARNPHGGLVAIYLERSLEMLVGMLAILKSGAPYLPLDLDHPPQRLSLMLEDSGASALLTSSGLLPALPDRPPSVVCIDQQPPDDLTEPAPLAAVTAEDLAYVLYTSGSTGRPKGVCISHRSVVNLLSSVARKPGMTANDTVMAITTYAFDIAATELWLPLVTGARLVIAAREVASDGRRLASLVERSKATIMQATPATWQMMLDSGWSGQPGLVAVSTGEPLPPALAESLLERAGSVWNMYGPTETTVWSSGERVEPGAPITIGRPIANTRAYILSRGRQLAPVGVAGELAIAGDGVGAGYLHRPELTDERFVADPFHEGERMYLTGDLARYRPDGRIEHLGRLDHQIKIRGFRVEPGEIEAALTATHDVAAALVLARGDGPAEMRLVAYVVPAGIPPAASDLRDRLRAVLPAYMVPSFFVTLDALPLSANGKIDRGALPEPKPGQDVGGARVATPRSAEEERMVAIWARILGVDALGVDDDFFELGGHSLLALRLLLEVERGFGVEIPVSSFFDSATVTVAGLAAKVERARGGGRSGGADAGLSARGTPILFFVQPWDSAMAALRHFARTLGSDYRVVGMLPERAGGRFDRSRTIEDLARPMLETVRENQPHGPYYIAGYSLGGLLAYEIAGRLRVAGEQVAWLGLLDASSPALVRRTFSVRERARRLWRRDPRATLAMIHEASWRALTDRFARRPDTERTPRFDVLGALWLIRRYNCLPNDAAMDLFVSDSTLPGDELANGGWDRGHAGPLRVHRVGGDHAAMMRDGNVDDLAEMVSARVKEARSQVADDAKPGTAG